LNLPNKLTVARAVLVPVFLALLLIGSIPLHWLLACIVFVVAALTDFFDGQIARKRGLVTNFGKFLDPLADKVLVTAALVAFVELGLSSSVAVIVIISRDLMVSGIRMLASSGGEVIAANWWGKVKTALQMTAIIAILLACQVFPNHFDTVAFWSGIAVWILAAYTALSGFIYLIQNKHLISSK